MKNHYILFFITLLFISLWSCDEDELPNPEPEIPQDSGYTQYGTPFSEIPENSNIIMYEVNLRAFSQSGDLQGVIQKLDHIESLGVNVIWLMPIYPIGEINTVNSPYCVKDYKSVGDEFGTLEDLRELTTLAHNRGIAVLIDWVANHTSWDNEWIQNKDWYSQDYQGNIIHPSGTNWEDVADLNYSNYEMRAAMIDAMKYWALEANIDGFRCDYADGIPYDFWQSAIDSIRSIPDREFIMFAEGARTNHFDAGFDLAFGWEYYGALKEAFNGESVNNIINANGHEHYLLPAGKQWVRFSTNHDESAWDATPVNLFHGIDGALAASVITIFQGCVPLIYGSQEVGTQNNIPFFSNNPIDWSLNPEMLEAYQIMLQYYSSSETARNGTHTTYISDDDVLLFSKSMDNEEIAVLVNIRNAEIDYVIPSSFHFTSWIDIMTQEPVELMQSITLEPFEFLILEH
jgi:glycosidase